VISALVVGVHCDGVCDQEAERSECQALCDLWTATGKNITGWCNGGKICDWDASKATKHAVCGDDGRLQVLSLSHLELKGTIPESFGNLVTLERMEFGENQFTGSLPESIGKMTKLSTIVVHDNKLTGSIPESIGDASALTQILAFNNELSGAVPASLGKLANLQALALFNNKLTSWTSESVCGLLKGGLECSLAANPFACPIPSCASNCSATCSPSTVVV